MNQQTELLEISNTATIDEATKILATLKMDDIPLALQKAGIAQAVISTIAGEVTRRAKLAEQVNPYRPQKNCSLSGDRKR